MPGFKLNLPPFVSWNSYLITFSISSKRGGGLRGIVVSFSRVTVEMKRPVSNRCLAPSALLAQVENSTTSFRLFILFGPVLSLLSIS